MSERLELHHVEHLIAACENGPKEALLLGGAMAVVATIIRQRDAAEAVLVRCESCGFGYSAEHSNADGSYSCPLCELGVAEARAVRCEGERDEARREFIEAHLMIREIKGIMAPCICRRCREYSAALPR